MPQRVQIPYKPRTLEVLDALERVDEFVAVGVPLHTIGMYTPEMKVLQHVSNAELDSPFPFALSLEQSKTERLLTRHLAGFGMEVEWGVELRRFVQDDAGVTAVLDHAGGPEESVRVSYLIGCDGAHSTIRHTLGVTFAGEDYPTDFAVADVRIDWRAAIPAHELCFFVGPEGMMFYGPFAEFEELETAVAQKRADVAVSVQKTETGVFYSHEFITFANYAISKKAAGLQIERVADLKNHPVLAWQNAYVELGLEFEQLFSPVTLPRTV